MSLSTTTGRYAGNGDGVSVTFPVTFKFLKTTDLLVYVGGVLKTLTTDYSVSGAGSDSGGSVTFVAAPAVGTGNVVIVRDVDLLQSSKYPSNDAFPSTVTETALDKLTMMVQRARDLLSRAFVFSDSDTSGASLVVPTPSAAKFLRWNATATGLENADVTGGGSIGIPVSIAQGGTNATTAAAARTSLGLGSLAVKSTVDTADITPAAVTYAKLQNVAAYSLVGNLTGSSAAPAAAAIDAAFLIGGGGTTLSVFRPNGARQTVISGPVDSSGLAAFGGSTGSTTVTMSGTLVATAANGFGVAGALDVVGSGTNLSWTGLSTNGTMYLYVDVASGVLTPGSTTLAPTYQWGGTYSTTNGQNTYNIQEGVMKAGNGSAANAVTRVFVGQVTVAGGVVTAITWYALNGRFISTDTAITAATRQAFSHNIGTMVGLRVEAFLVNQSAEQGYTAGMIVPAYTNGDANAVGTPAGTIEDALTASITPGSNATSFSVTHRTAGTRQAATNANWKTRLHVFREW